MNVVKMYFGSHLYGTNTPESDTDIKGIFIPTKEQVLLGKVPKTINDDTNKGHKKNTSEDIDCEMYSLQYFIKLACEGQTVALDMLHAPDNMIVETSPIWKEIVDNRELFYSRNLKAFVGYARKQAAKYGIKGSRLNAAKEFLDVLKDYDESLKLRDIWDVLPLNEHSYFLSDNVGRLPTYWICGKQIQNTVNVKYAKSMIETFYQNYGARAILASENKNIDWKAISHAVRCAMQVEELLVDNTITFPLKEADLVLQIKQGLLDYTNVVAPLLEEKMRRVEALALVSKLPKSVDVKFWNDFIIKTLERELFDH